MTDRSNYQFDLVLLRDNSLNPASFGDVDPSRRISFGPLLDELLTTPRDLAGSTEPGAITVKVQRTHEWELVVSIVVWGAKAFAAAAVAELGKRFVGWLVDLLKNRGTSGQSVIGKGSQQVEVSSDTNPDGPVKGQVAELLLAAAERGCRVQITIEPQPR